MADQEGKQEEKNPSSIVAKAFADVAETEAGQIVFRWMMQQCHYQVSTIVGNPQTHDINAMGTIFNEARRRFYLDLRRYIPVNIRRKIEN